MNKAHFLKAILFAGLIIPGFAFSLFAEPANEDQSSSIKLRVVAALASAEPAKETAYTLSDTMTPFWAKDTMINESVLMVSNGTESPKARLLFPAIKILSVKNAALDKTYKEGVDWVCANDTLESR